MLFDVLHPHRHEILAIAQPSPRPGLTPEQLRNPRQHLAGRLAATAVNDDILAHIWLVHLDMPDPELAEGQSLGAAMPSIDLEAGVVRWTRQIVGLSPAEKAEKLEARRAEICRIARRENLRISSGWTTAEIGGEDVSIATNDSAFLRIWAAELHMTRNDLPEIPVVTSAGRPVMMTGAIRNEMENAVTSLVAACEERQNEIVTFALDPALTLEAAEAFDPYAGWPGGA